MNWDLSYGHHPPCHSERSEAESKNPFSFTAKKGTDPSTSFQNSCEFFHFAQDDSGGRYPVAPIKTERKTGI